MDSLVHQPINWVINIWILMLAYDLNIHAAMDSGDVISI
jgi:hypothetical protein